MIHLSGYLFKKLTHLLKLQQDLQALCQQKALKGTILLSHEGINCFICGDAQSVNHFQHYLKTKGLDLIFNQTHTAFVPFKRLCVKIKPEIISMGAPLLPLNHQAPYLDPQTFKHWLDTNKEMIVLDTRNDYEVAWGQFKKATTLQINCFRDFPKAIQTLPDNALNKPIVTYCTGGVRCEKAAPYLAQKGYQVYQLKGGILNYLKKSGSAHFQGTCFVFDSRLTLDSNLTPAHPSCWQQR